MCQRASHVHFESILSMFHMFSARSTVPDNRFAVSQVHFEILLHQWRKLTPQIIYSKIFAPTAIFIFQKVYPHFCHLTAIFMFQNVCAHVFLELRPFFPIFVRTCVPRTAAFILKNMNCNLYISNVWAQVCHELRSPYSKICVPVFAASCDVYFPNMCILMCHELLSKHLITWWQFLNYEYISFSPC
jgi:hypothetical protein